VGIDDAVAIAAIHWIVIDRQRQKAVGMRRGRLWGKVAEHFRAAVDNAIPVAVKDQEGIIRIRGPCNLDRRPGVGDIKLHAVRSTGKKKTITC
jgi:hypothetical protein